MLNRSILPAFLLLTLLAFPAAAKITLSVEHMSETPVIILKGEFEYTDDPSELEKLVANSGARGVFFNSGGGNIVAAIAYGRKIRALRLGTFQPRALECASACALAFLGGIIRYADPGAIGVHQSSFAPGHDIDSSDAVASVQSITAEIISYVVEMGVDPRLLQLSLSTESHDMRYLTAQEMKTLNVTTDGKVDVDDSSTQAPSSRTAKRTSARPSRTEIKQAPSPRSAEAKPGMSLEQAALTMLYTYSTNASRRTTNEEAAARIDARLYATDVDYHGKRASRVDILLDKSRYAVRWPMQIQSVTPGTEIVSCENGYCTTSAVVEWFAENRSHSRKAAGTSTLTLVWDIDNWRIVKETNKVIARDVLADGRPRRLFEQIKRLSRDCPDDYIYDEESINPCARAYALNEALSNAGWCSEHGSWSRCEGEEIPATSLSATPRKRASDADERQVRPLEFNGELPLCPEPDSESSATNENGVVLKYVDGSRLYIGNSCDVLSTKFGAGEWRWANGGVYFQFSTCRMGWARVEPPIDDPQVKSRCRW